MNSPASRTSAIDPMRLVLAISVIALHTGFPHDLPDQLRQILVNGLYRVAVPVFAVISGYFFASALGNGRALPYIRRILSLYLLWMLIYLPIYGPDINSVGHALQMLFFGYFHLWYLPGLIISALLVLALSRAPGWVMAGLAAMCALIGLGLQYLVLSGRISLSLDLYRNGLFVIFPYFASGYLLARAGVRGLPWRYGIALALLALSAVVGESLIWFHIAGGAWGVDNMLSLLLAAPLVFLAAMGLPGSGDGKRIAEMATFVYFFHILMMITASRFGLDGNTKALFVMVVSVAVAWALSTGNQRPILKALT